MTVSWHDDRGHVIPPPPPAPPASLVFLPAPRKSRRKAVAWTVVGVVIVAVIGGNAYSNHEDKVNAKASCLQQYNGLLQVDGNVDQQLDNVAASLQGTDEQATPDELASASEQESKSHAQTDAIYQQCLAGIG